MTPDQCREAFEQRFKTLWGSRTIFFFENEKWVEPAADVRWVRFVVRHFGGGQETLGPHNERIYRRIGQAVGQVFSPLSRGMSTGGSDSHALRAMFEGESFAGIDCTNGRVLEIGPDGKHHQTNVEIDFNYDEKK